MSETIYFEDASARIGNAWFVFRDGAYRVQDVETVTTRTIHSNRSLWLFGFLFLPMMVMSIGFYLRADNSFDLNVAHVFAFIFVLLFLSSLYSIITQPNNSIYLLELRGAFDRTTAFASLNKEEVDLLADTMGRAMDNKIVSSEEPKLLEDVASQMADGRSLLLPTFFTDRIVSITSDTVRPRDETRELSSVKSVRLGIIKFQKFDDLCDVLTVIGLMLFAVSLLFKRSTDDFGSLNYWLLTLTGGAGLFLNLGAALMRIRNTTTKVHLIELRGTFGRVNAFVTLDQTLAKGIVAEVDSARKRQSKGLSTPTGTPT